MAVEEIFKILSGYGLPGLIIGALLWMYRVRDIEFNSRLVSRDADCKAEREEWKAEREGLTAQLAAERSARTSDAKEYGASSLAILRSTNEFVDKLKSVADVLGSMRKP